MDTCQSCGKPADSEKSVSYYKGTKLVALKHPECVNREEREDFSRTGKLSTNLMMTATLHCARAGLHIHGVDDDVREACDRLQEDVSRLCIEAWFGGATSVAEVHGLLKEKMLVYPRQKDSLQSIVEDSPHRTLEARRDGVTFTGQEMAGRVLLQIEDEHHRITLITGSGEQTKRMGIQGIDGTEDGCRTLIHLLRVQWRSLKFKPVRQ